MNPYKSSKKSAIDIPVGEDDDSRDEDFKMDSDVSESKDDGENVVTIFNSELTDSLPFKTIPTTGHYSGQQKCTSIMVEDVKDVDSAQDIRE
ncbi:hypothetical protein E4T56_gene15472 [Termitomyces sp. T112]|nr:hypothetical protein E4T56_gene15472 [Termitomyces sp. T112]